MSVLILKNKIFGMQCQIRPDITRDVITFDFGLLFDFLRDSKWFNVNPITPSFRVQVQTSFVTL